MAHDDTCPVCVLYTRLCSLTGLLEDAVPIVEQTGGPLPAGLGGTVALARRRAGEALTQIGPVARMVPGWQVAELGQHLQVLHGQLSGFVPSGIWLPAAESARSDRRWAYNIAGAHFARAHGVVWTP